MSVKNLVWFRSDLRTRDNRALHAACSSRTGVAGLFVLSPGDWRRHDDAPCKIDLMLRTLRELAGGLERLNVPLLIRTAPTPDDVPSVVAGVVRELGARSVHWNEEYPVHERQRDAATAAALKSAGCEVVTHADQVVLAPGSVLTGEGRPFTVFTPFKRAWLKKLAEEGGIRLLGAPAKQEPCGLTGDAPPMQIGGFESPIDPGLWPAGETHALKRLSAFIGARARRYKAERDFPALDGTSTLSPYLTIGAISPRQCVAAAAEANEGRLDGGSEGLATWISEVVWREFYKHVIAAFPRVSMGRAFKPATDRIVWSDSQSDFEAWKDGRTGYPIVDAAMRQLRATGWMHNRLRMVAAMFLTKDLFINWRWGEQHFMRSLVDGDIGQNNGGWQWSASTGTDAAPYFRIFNPISQSAKFDPDGAFIKKYVPELASLSGEAIHDPSQLPPLARQRIDYPEPIVDHAKARERVLAAFKAVGGA